MSTGIQKLDAIEALITMLERITIAGGGYFDLADRVFPNLVLPEDGPDFTKEAAEDWAYLCVSLNRERHEFHENDDGEEFTITVYGFVGESEHDPLRSAQIALVCKLQRNVLDVVRADRTLRGTALSCWEMTEDSVAGWPQTGKRYGEMRQPFRVTYYVD